VKTKREQQDGSKKKLLELLQLQPPIVIMLLAKSTMADMHNKIIEWRKVTAQIANIHHFLL
jgi:hypothetical protein